MRDLPGGLRQLPGALRGWNVLSDGVLHELPAGLWRVSRMRGRHLQRDGDLLFLPGGLRRLPGCLR